MTLLLYKQIQMPLERSQDIAWPYIDDNIGGYLQTFVKKNTRFLGYADCSFYVKAVVRKVENLFVVYTDSQGHMRVDTKIEKKVMNFVFSSKAFPRSDEWLEEIISKIQNVYHTLSENFDSVEVTLHTRISGHKVYSQSSDYVHLSIDKMGEGMKKQYSQLKLDMKKFVFRKPEVNIYYAKIKPTLLLAFSHTTV